MQLDQKFSLFAAAKGECVDFHIWFFVAPRATVMCGSGERKARLPKSEVVVKAGI